MDFNLYVDLQSYLDFIDEHTRISITNETDKLLTKNRIVINDLKKSPIWNHFNNIIQFTGLRNPRQILYHSLNAIIPVCICGKLVKWKEYRYRTFCSSKCSMSTDAIKNKIKETNILKYGCENPLQNKDVYAKLQATNIERYGHKRALDNAEIKNKSIQTTIKNYGVSCSLSSPIVQEKIRNTNQERYGVNYPQENDIIRGKTIASVIDKYGVSHISKLPEISAKRKETVKNRFGVEFASQHPDVKTKVQTTLQQKYGVNNAKQIHYSPETTAFLQDDVLFADMISKYPMYIIAKKYNISTYPIYCKMKKLGLDPIKQMRSEFEKELSEFISSISNVTLVSNTRQLISPKEIDIYLPDNNFAIECNGTYWHSELNGKNKKYHLDKTDACNLLGISLFHVWYHDWIDKQDIIKSMIAHKLGKSNKLHARKTEVREISHKHATEFLNENHIQGYSNATIKLGLFHEDELFSVMTFGKPRFNKNYQWELIRFATKLNHVVVGGASKLLKYFIGTYNPDNMLSYADRSRGNGNIYETIGFTNVGISEPSYYYTENYTTIHNRLQFQHKLLENKLDLFYPEMSEWENMKLNGYDRIWDCGNSVWVWTK